MNFAAGQATQTVSVTINGDTTVEANETFFVNLSNATNGGIILDAQGLGTISNDDATPAVGNISIGDVTISEGDAGTKTASFTVSHSGSEAFAVDFATANGTATASSDYVAAAGTLNFATGQATQTVSVTINGDTTVEANETFFVNLSNATNGGTILDAQGLGTISNDDAPPNSTTFEKRVVSGLDDVEQNASGSMYINSSDLELVKDGTNVQTVGIRFTGIDIPKGAIITNAYIQFQVDEVSTVATSLAIRGEDADTAAAFTSVANNVSSRPSTDASTSAGPRLAGRRSALLGSTSARLICRRSCRRSSIEAPGRHSTTWCSSSPVAERARPSLSRAPRPARRSSILITPSARQWSAISRLAT